MVAVDGIVPVAIEVADGYFGEGYGGQWFKRTNTGNEKALVVLRWVELSSGEWERTPI